MGTGNSSKAANAAKSAATGRGDAKGRAAEGRAGTTKVSLPAGVAARREAANPSPVKKRRPAPPPRPWYRQGRFWFVVIVLEVVVAFGLSVRYLPKSDQVSLDGAELGQFCQQVAQNPTFTMDAPVADVNSAADVWGARLAVLRALQPVAPEDVRPDIDDLITLTDEAQRLANDVKARNASEPGYDGTAVILAKDDQLRSEGELAISRLDVAVRTGCGVDLATRTGVTTTVAPGPTSTEGPPAPSTTGAPGGPTPTTASG